MTINELTIQDIELFRAYSHDDDMVIVSGNIIYEIWMMRGCN